MSPIRLFSTIVNWVLFILFIVGVIWLIVARVKHNKKWTKYSLIFCIVVFILQVIAFRFSIHLANEGVQ